MRHLFHLLFRSKPFKTAGQIHGSILHLHINTLHTRTLYEVQIQESAKQMQWKDSNMKWKLLEGNVRASCKSPQYSPQSTHIHLNVSFVSSVLGKGCLPCITFNPICRCHCIFPLLTEGSFSCAAGGELFPRNIFNLLSENIPLSDPSLILTPGQAQQVISAFFSWRDNFLWYM